MLNKSRKSNLDKAPRSRELFLFVMPMHTPDAGQNETWRHFQSAFDNCIPFIDLTSRLQGAVLGPVLLNPEIAKIPDGYRFSRSENTCKVTLNIPFSEWFVADRVRRVELGGEMLGEAIARIPSSLLNDEDRFQLLNLVGFARQVGLSSKTFNTLFPYIR